jgi:hypothetical protein
LKKLGGLLISRNRLSGAMRPASRTSSSASLPSFYFPPPAALPYLCILVREWFGYNQKESTPIFQPALHPHRLRNRRAGDGGGPQSSFGVKAAGVIHEEFRTALRDALWFHAVIGEEDPGNTTRMRLLGHLCFTILAGPQGSKHSVFAPTCSSCHFVSSFDNRP